MNCKQRVQTTYIHITHYYHYYLKMMIMKMTMGGCEGANADGWRKLVKEEFSSERCADDGMQIRFVRLIIYFLLTHPSHTDSIYELSIEISSFFPNSFITEKFLCFIHCCFFLSIHFYLLLYISTYISEIKLLQKLNDSYTKNDCFFLSSPASEPAIIDRPTVRPDQPKWTYISFIYVLI